MARTFPGGLAQVNAEQGQVDEFLGLAANYSTVPTARFLTVATNTQIALFSSFTIDGGVTVDGELRVVNWPS
ncbi:MAG: hypothetical protein Q8R92_16730 [Deltaproteobacteria bacterium]|nr:hypothetical protein [Deltaproteobacteria bacterium]